MKVQRAESPILRAMKRCLLKTLGMSEFVYEEIAYNLAEIEIVLNSRPLTYVSMDDLEEPLTFSHLLVGR